MTTGRINQVFLRQKCLQGSILQSSPGCTFDAGHKKTHFSEFSVFSAFCTKNGAVTKTGDIGKTFSGLKNLAVLQGFATKNPNELG